MSSCSKQLRLITWSLYLIFFVIKLANDFLAFSGLPCCFLTHTVEAKVYHVFGIYKRICIGMITVFMALQWRLTKSAALKLKKRKFQLKILKSLKWNFDPLFKILKRNVKTAMKFKFNKSSAVAEMGDRLATIDMGRKVGADVRTPFHWRSWSQSNTVWPGPRPTSVPSGTFIHPTGWPQYTNVIDRHRTTVLYSIERTVTCNGRAKNLFLALCCLFEMKWNETLGHTYTW